ncbi:MAG: hypothetical protein IJ183_05930 [Prevotella sp.]|nr:hypothetical protein [Prevotella sp.]
MNYLIQYALTILTIVLIPLLLWLGKERSMARATYATFLLLIIADLATYFLLGQVTSYLYLAVITFLSLFLVKRK